MNHKRLSNHWWKVGDQRSFRKHLLISFIGKGQSVIRGMFKSSQVLFSKLLAIPLLSEEGIGKAIGMVRFESLPFSRSLTLEIQRQPRLVGRRCCSCSTLCRQWCGPVCGGQMSYESWEAVELSLSGLSMSPLSPRAPGSLYWSVPCILMLEKGVQWRTLLLTQRFWEPWYVPWPCARDVELSDSRPLPFRSPALSQGRTYKTPVLGRQLLFLLRFCKPFHWSLFVFFWAT